MQAQDGQVTAVSPQIAAKERTHSQDLETFACLQINSLDSENGHIPYSDLTQNDLHLVQLEEANSSKVSQSCSTEQSILSQDTHKMDCVSEFEEEKKRVRSAMERYKLEQLEKEEQLSRELHQREVLI